MLAVTLDFLKYREPYDIIFKALDMEINRHLSAYPNDMQLLSDIIGIVIRHVPMVWCKENGKCYHSTPSCSKLKNPVRIPLAEIETMGYTKCKRCFPKE